ncbi:hypothetical protein [Yersinia pseudotuberculosis]|uniref:hypothetical protein n=1 Tax=Yersinia pseudotuberculosis TaxID=633 RepID=UPI0038B44DCA
MLSKEHLESLTRVWVETHLVNKMATELLSLREQIAELKAMEPVGYVNRDELDNIEPGVSGAMIYPERDAYSSVPLFTAAKSAED